MIYPLHHTPHQYNPSKLHSIGRVGLANFRQACQACYNRGFCQDLSQILKKAKKITKNNKVRAPGATCASRPDDISLELELISMKEDMECLEEAKQSRVRSCE